MCVLSLVPLHYETLSKMRFPPFIHDPEFEADFIEDNYEDDETTFGERLSVLNEQYMNINNMQEDYVRALIRDLFDLYDHAEQESELLYMRESIYLVCKSLVTPVGRECLRKDKDFLETCMWRVDLTLGLIDDLEDYIDENDYNAWKNTENTIIEFLNIAHNM